MTALSIGVAIGAATLEASTRLRGASIVGPEDFAYAFWVVAIIAGLSALAFIRLPPDAGAEMSGHRAFKRKAPSTGLEVAVEPR